ncbi:MAG TPA: twin-arginine translocase TatA/TatE family subunit [Actinomycetota bacterium]|jgi:sec-independent protein translocase protein TatA|nr:twin-arginine translocase TatA/TatE family subunit [Actinomycetota bacterium]
MPGPEWIWVILVIVVVFGASRLPLVGRNVGQGIKEFKKGVSEGVKDEPKPADRPAQPPATDEHKPLS